MILSFSLIWSCPRGRDDLAAILTQCEDHRRHSAPDHSDSLATGFAVLGTGRVFLENVRFQEPRDRFEKRDAMLLIVGAVVGGVPLESAGAHERILRHCRSHGDELNARKQVCGTEDAR